MEEPAPSSPATKVALAWLFIVLLVQGVVILGSLVMFGLGGAPADEVLLVLGGVGAATVLCLVLLLRQVRRASAPKQAAWGLVVPAVDVLAFVLAFAIAGGPRACSSEDASLLASVATPSGVAMQGDPAAGTGTCGQAYLASVPLRHVLRSYRTTLESQGWTITLDDIQTQGGAEGGAMRSGELDASRGTARLSVNGEEVPDGSGGSSVNGVIYADGSL